MTEKKKSQKFSVSSSSSPAKGDKAAKPKKAKKGPKAVPHPKQPPIEVKQLLGQKEDGSPKWAGRVEAHAVFRECSYPPPRGAEGPFFVWSRAWGWSAPLRRDQLMRLLGEKKSSEIKVFTFFLKPALK